MGEDLGLGGQGAGQVPLSASRRAESGGKPPAVQGGEGCRRLTLIGYCFGGTGVLELVRSGADVKAAGLKNEFIANPGALHAISQQTAGNDNSNGSAYTASADEKSWEKMSVCEN